MPPVHEGSSKLFGGKFLLIELGIRKHDQRTSTAPTLMSIKSWVASTNRSSQPYLYAWPSSGPPRSSACGISVSTNGLQDVYASHSLTQIKRVSAYFQIDLLAQRETSTTILWMIGIPFYFTKFGVVTQAMACVTIKIHPSGRTSRQRELSLRVKLAVVDVIIDASSAPKGHSNDAFHWLLTNGGNQLAWQFSNTLHPHWPTTLILHVHAIVDASSGYFYTISVKTADRKSKCYGPPWRWNVRGFGFDQPLREKAYTWKRRLPALQNVCVTEVKEFSMPYTFLIHFHQFNKMKYPKERRNIVLSNNRRLLLEMSLPIYKITQHRSLYWNNLAAIGKLTRCSADNTDFVFYPGRKLLPLNPKYPVGKITPCDSLLEPVTRSSSKGVNSVILNSSLALKNWWNLFSCRKDQVSFTDPCSAFQGLTLCSLFGGNLPSSCTSVIVNAVIWHSEDPDEAQSDGDDLNRWQQQNRPPDLQTAGTRNESRSVLRAPIECTDGSSDDSGRERAERSGSHRSVSPEAESQPYSTLAGDLSGIRVDCSGVGCSYADCHVAPIYRWSHDRLPSESGHRCELSPSAARKPSSCDGGGTSPHLLQGSSWGRHRDGSREVAAGSDATVNDRAGTRFARCSGSRQHSEPQLGRCAVVYNDGELESGYALCEAADDGGDEESSRFSDVAAGKNWCCALRRADAFRRSGGRAHGCSCDHFDDGWLSNVMGQRYPIEVVDDDLTKCPGSLQCELPEGCVGHLMNCDEPYESNRKPSEVIDLEYADDADGDCFDKGWLSNVIGQRYPIEVVDDDLTQIPGDRQCVLPEGCIGHLMNCHELHASTRQPSEVIDVEYRDEVDDEAKQNLIEGSVLLVYCETLAESDVAVRGRDDHGHDSAGDSRSVQAVDGAPAAEEGLPRSRRPSTL